MPSTIYCNLRTPDGSPAEIHCSNGRFVLAAPAGSEIVDCGGDLLLPALVEPHVHLDKTLWGMPWRPNSAGPALKDFIANERQVLREIEVPIVKRAGLLLEQMVSRGTLHVRCHIDIGPDIGVKHVEAMLELRAAYGDVVDMQFVAFPQTGLLIQPGTAGLMEEALRMGVETVGGLDPAGIDNDPIAHLKLIFGMAERHGKGVDIHLHDRGELGLWQIARIADFTEGAGLAGKVMISHAYCLGMFSESRIEKLGQRLAALGISLMTSVPADTTVPPVEYLTSLGVNVCCGSDGIRDAWSPSGNGDMLERAFLTGFRFDWVKDAQLEAAFACATTHGAKALGLAGYGIAPGNIAHFMFLPAETIGDALGRRPLERTVVSHGRIVAQDGTFLHSRQ